MTGGLLVDEVAFLYLAQQRNRAYRNLLRESFQNNAALYLLPEVVLYLYQHQNLNLPLSVFEPFRLLTPETAVLVGACRWAVKKQLPLHRALIIYAAHFYRTRVAIIDYHLYGGLGLPHHYRHYISG